MRILFIGENIYDEESYKNFLSTIAEQDSIYFVYTLADAVDFINNRIVAQQESLDLIILKEQKKNNYNEDFKDFIENDHTRTYSKRDFNLIKIPIVLILETSKNIIFHKKRGYADVIVNMGVDRFSVYKPKLISCIKSWRRQVLDELDNLGIEFNSGQLNYGLFFTSKKNPVRSTEILAKNFQLFPRKLRYYWLEDNRVQIEKAIDEFIKMLKRSALSNKKDELGYHKFFNKNSFFLERDRYSRTWHEVKLKREGNKHYDPDFTMRPNFNYKTDLSLIEVKLPTESFLQTSTFHKTFLAKIVKHLAQVNDYKDYLEEQGNHVYINNQFGFIPKRVDYNILIGRQRDKEENIYSIDKRMRQFNQKHIHLMTYDELYDYQVKYLFRMNMLQIT